MNKIAIRPASLADIAEIAAIYADAVLNGTASYELEPPDEMEMAARYRSLVASQFPYLVAEGDGRVLGYAYAGPFRARPAYRFIVEDSVYVTPDAKGRGIGRLLLESLLDQAGALGFRQMLAVIGDGRPESPSVRLHETLSFRHCGTLTGTGYKHGRWLDTAFMQRAMNGGSESEPDPSSLPERRFRS